jgi:hypothetical protein
MPFMFLIVGLLLCLDRLNKLSLGYLGVILVGFTGFVAFHAAWEMYEHSMDRFFGTNLQPGGMMEATDNNFFAIVGALLAIAVLHYWRKADSFEAYLLSPLTGYLGQPLASRRARPRFKPAWAVERWKPFGKTIDREVGHGAPITPAGAGQEYHEN